MTEEEAKKVKVGDILWAKYGNRYHIVEVVKIDKNNWNGCLQFHLFKKGEKREDRLGNPLPAVIKTSRNIGWAAENECRKDPETCNVMADWLEENGYAEAGAALRREFPLVPKKE